MLALLLMLVAQRSPVAVPSNAAVLGPLLAFPFGQGYKVGSTLVGGRLLGAGEVRKVTNLNDAGAGSLRAALSTAGPADIVFEVGGAIPISSESIFFPSDVTVWGETAPSPGITIIPSDAATFYTNSNSGFIGDVTGDNVVVRHLRFRLRHDHANGPNGISALAIGQSSPFLSRRTIFANCSFDCGENETAFIALESFDHTFYRCIIGNSYYSSKGSLLSPDDFNPSHIRAAFIQCLWPRLAHRSPYAKMGVHLALYNNYWYACGSGGGGKVCGNGFSPQIAAVTITPMTATYSTVRGNLYEANASNDWPFFEYDESLGDATPNHESYWNDNDTLSRCIDGVAVVDADANESDLDMVLPEVATVRASAGLKSYLLPKVGARPKDRDSRDTTIIDDATNLTGGAPSEGVAPPSYSLGTGSATFTDPGSGNQQAAGEATGWRNRDKYIYQNYTLAVEN